MLPSPLIPHDWYASRWAHKNGSHIKCENCSHVCAAPDWTHAHGRHINVKPFILLVQQTAQVKGSRNLPIDQD